MDADLKVLLREWDIAQQYIDKLDDQEVHNVETLFSLTDTEICEIFTKCGPRAHFKSKLKDAVESVDLTEEDLTDIARDIVVTTLKMASSHFCVFSKAKQLSLQLDKNLNESSEKNNNQAASASTSVAYTEGERSNLEAATASISVATTEGESSSSIVDVSSNQCHNQEAERPTPNNIRIAPSHFNKRPAQALDEESTLKRLCMGCLNGKLVLSYYKENNELNDDTRNYLADVILNDYLKDDYNRKIPVDVEQSMTDNVLKLFPTEKKEIWMSSTLGNRDSAVGRGKLITRYYGKRRIMKKAGLLKKAAEKEDSDLNAQDLIDIDVDPTEFNDKVLWLANTKTFSSRLTEYWKFTSKGRLRQFIGKNTPVAEYMEKFPALLDKSGHVLLEMDYETLFEGTTMSLYAEWPFLSAFIESKVPKTVQDNIDDALTPEGKKIRTIHALPYLLNVVTAAKKGKNKQWRPSREECAESLLLHVVEPSGILTTLAHRLKEKYEPYGLSLGPQAIVVGQTVDSITNCYVRVNAVLYEVESPLKAVDIAFKIMHALDCQYPKETEREWFFLERSVYRINIDKKNPLTAKTTAICSDFSRFKRS